MLSLQALWFALTLEGALIGGCLIGLMSLRLLLAGRTRRVERGLRALEPRLHEWLIGDGAADDVVQTLREMPRRVAFSSAARLTTAYLTFERQQMLAPLLRDEPWVRRMLRQGRSSLWWRRFDVARLLSLVGGPEDVALVQALIHDPHPAVRLVAIDAAARLGGRLVDVELDVLPSRQDAVQAYQFAALARHGRVVAQALVTRLSVEAETTDLIPWIDAAGALASPDALQRVLLLARHRNAEVRLHVARALRRLATPEAVTVLRRLLADTDWRVRAQAARALGALRVGDATDALAEAVRDSSWWVRYRAALALAQIGGRARDSLLAVAAGDDPLARDMSVLVAGLSSAAVVEMSEV